jgi:hypothetical protein
MRAHAPSEEDKKREGRKRSHPVKKSSRELVPDPAYRLKVGGSFGIRLDLSPKRSYMTAQTTGVDFSLQCPYLTEQLLSRNGPPSIAEKTLQDAELCFGKAKFFPVFSHRPLLKIDGQCPE